MSKKNTQNDFGTALEEEVKIKEPRECKVLLHNDDFTPMNFVIDIIMKIFYVSFPRATKLMLEVHNKGVAVCGIYSYEIAETKIIRVHEESKKHGFPLKSSMEEV